MTPSSEDENPGISEAWMDFQRHRAAEERKSYGRRPKKIGNVIAQLVNRRGYAQIREAGEQDKAWRAAVGEPLAKITQVSALRRGTLEVLVANSLLMQELSFRKEELLARLQEELPRAGVKQLKFKIGRIEAS